MFAVGGSLTAFDACLQVELTRLKISSSVVLREVQLLLFSERCFWKALVVKDNGQVHGLQNLE